MKTVWIASLSILLFVSSAYAHMESLSVEEMINSMMVDQNVTSVSELDCGKIPDSEFEELGDAVMGRMIGNTALHEQMDTMMGGEGSESLRQMHVAMGKNWLDCGTGFQGMMGYGSMMPMMMRMMGSYYPAYYASYNSLFVFTVIGWILFIITLVILILVITGNVRIQKKKR